MVEKQTELLRKERNRGTLMNTEETRKEEASSTSDAGNGIREVEPVSATSSSGAEDSMNSNEVGRYFLSNVMNQLFFFFC